MQQTQVCFFVKLNETQASETKCIEACWSNYPLQAEGVVDTRD